MDSTNYIILITIFLTLLISRLKHRLHSNIITAWLANFTGTLFHELAHLFVSFVLNGKPVKLSLLPQKNEKGYTLGYVQSSNITWYNAFPISMAPLLLLFMVYLIYNYYFNYFNVTITSYIIYIILLVSFLDSALPSSQDFKVAFSNFGGFLYVALLFLYLIFRYYNINIRG